jgi:hypothetical protein
MSDISEISSFYYGNKVLNFIVYRSGQRNGHIFVPFRLIGTKTERPFHWQETVRSIS